ncbi:MAG TPA: metal ABC transporter substrate-binding protein [bacterium]|nr:metal ABC transporter substrate-binding protein [bacterium]HPR88599.1 metal ABC transporter substrate-binding protein [bacterium]
MKQASRKCIVLILGLALAGCTGGDRNAPASGKLVVAASIHPLADFVRQVGGDQVEVTTIISGIANPHTFELTPDVVRRASRARLLILNGMGLEFWAPKLVDTIGNERLRIVETASGIPPLAAVDEEHEHPGGNPHVWLSPPLAMHQVEAIRDALIALDPGHAALFRRNSAAYLDSLRMLDNAITLEVAGWMQRSFICFHPSWSYFAQQYKLNQAAVIETRPGLEPTPHEIVQIIGTARNLDINAIFAEKQFPTRISETIARECGARVLLLDPLGEEQPGFGYLQLMRQNVAQMALAMK